MNRYDKQANYVAAPSVERQESLPLVGLDGVLAGDSIHVGQPLAAHHGTHEQTSGMDRSLAWGVRLIPYTIIVMLLALTLTRLAGGSWLLGFVLFSSLSLGLYALLDYREHKYSRNGLELHKVDSLVYLKAREQDNEQEIKLLVVQSQIEMWRAQRGYDGTRALAVGGRTIAGRITDASAYDTEEDGD